MKHTVETVFASSGRMAAVSASTRKRSRNRAFADRGISAARIRLDHSQLMALWKKIRPVHVRRPLLTG